MLKINFLFIYLLLISIEDIKNLKISNTILFGMFLTCFSFSLSTSSSEVVYSLFNASLFFIIFYIISKVTKGFGAGDVKLAFVIAFFSGFFKTVISLLIATILGLLFFVLKRLKKQNTMKIPFSPFMSVGVFISEFLFGLVL